MMAAILPDSDSEDELPPGWEERATLDGSVYYVNHATKGTQWSHPRTGKKKRVSGDLPTGWEKRVSEDGRVIYIDHSNQQTTYSDPRLAFASEEKEHAMDFRQRFDASSTALQVLHGCDLSGKVILVTGATNGIGFETAKSLAQHGAEVILSGRSESTCSAAEEKILEGRPNAKLFCLPMDLTSLGSVKHAAAVVKHRYKNLHCLLLNAGVIAMGWQLTCDNLESVFQINHLGHFYLTLLLEDVLHPGSRVVIVSSESHRQSSLSVSNISEEKLSPSSPSGYWDLMAYNNSKLCNILFGTELQRRWASRGVDVFSLHPGNLQQAAATSVFCAVAPELKGSGGVYLNNCCLCETTRAGKDAQLAKALWDTSEDIIVRKCGSISQPN